MKYYFYTVQILGKFFSTNKRVTFYQNRTVVVVVVVVVVSALTPPDLCLYRGHLLHLYTLQGEFCLLVKHLVEPEVIGSLNHPFRELRMYNRK